jgi:hypothetical protein
MSTELSRLRVGDEDFLVASMIERCPKAMMLRELVKNALEAAERADHSGAPPLRQVEIGALRVGGVRGRGIFR